jgi:8-amino-7-oxononanoate synthase
MSANTISRPSQAQAETFPLTLIDALYTHQELQPDTPVYGFIRDGGEDSISFVALAQRVNSVAVSLLRRAQPGERAVLLYSPGMDFIVAFLACLQAGITAVPAYPPGKHVRTFGPIANVLANCAPRLILTSESMQAQLLSHLEATGLGGRFELVCTDALPPVHEYAFRYGAIDPESTAFIQYTSGSTGAPKGVMISHRNIVHNLRSIQNRFGHSRASRGVIWLPPYHDMGLIGGILQPLFVGFPVKLMAPMTFVQKPLRWLQTISDFRATTSGGPNFAYELCVQKVADADLARLDLASWEVAFNGAEPISADGLQRFAERFGACGFRRESFFPCYGMAETTLMVTGGARQTPLRCLDVDPARLAEHRVAPPADVDSAKRLVGCGVPTEDHAVLIVHPETRQRAGAREIGEIWVSGPSVAQGYWQQPERNEQVFHARLAEVDDDRHWLRTGDLGFFGDAGELYIAGRHKDLVIIRGRNYHPQDIEATVDQAHAALRPGGGAAFSVAVRDEERLVIVHEVKREHVRDDLATAVDAIRRAVTERHELQAYAVVLLKPAGLPVTTSGKVKRHACRNAFLEGGLASVLEWKLNLAAAAHRPDPSARPRPAASQGSAEAICAWLKAAVAQQTHQDADAIDTARAFADHGLDSLQIATLSGELAEWLEFRVTPEAFHGLATIDSASRYLGAARDLGRSLAELSTEEKRQLLATLEGDQALSDRFEGQEVPAEFRSFEESTAYAEFEQRQRLLFQGQAKSPFFTVHEGLNNDRTVIGKREYVNYSCNNFLGLSGHPEVSEAAVAAIRRYGTSVSASRLVSGERPLHLELEREIAAWIDVEAALVFVGAATANVSAVGHLLGPNDLVLYDELSHNSLLQGIKLSHADSQPFRHNDYEDLDRILAKKRRQYEKVLVFVEGLYSMDGDVPDLARFIEVKKRHQAWLMVDECLSIGVVGATGRGIGEHCGVERGDVDIWMGGISKAFASCGGYIAGRRSLIQYLKYTTPGFIYTTGISPANAAAALAALRVLRQHPARVQTLRDRVALFIELAQKEGLDIGTSQGVAIVPVIVGDQAQCIRLYQALFQEGINVQPIVYPAVAANAARLRFSFNATHTEEQVRRTVATVAGALRQIRSAATRGAEA